MSIVDSLLPMSNNNNNSSNNNGNNKYYDYGNNHSFLLSPSSSNSIIKNNNNNSNNNYSILQTIIPGEQISTIFVVGFPENMQEREFQNMFMFSPGFEAATLKLLSNSNGTVVTTTTTNTMEDDSSRKQIIGFAKFRTRLEALDAKEILNGRKIDQEKGCILKAEMAKKNLHTKKELQQQQQQQNIKTPYEAFYSVPINMSEFSPSTSPPSTTTSSFNNNNNKNIIPTSTKSSSYSSSNRYLSKSILEQQHSLFGMMGNKKASTIYPTTTLSSSSLSSSSSLATEYPFLLHKLYNNNNNHEDIISSSSHLLSQLVVSSASTPILSLDSSTSTDYYYRNNNNNNIDQNPPCNTLYVGNLPPNTNEEELRSMFSKCPGYKRLSFRTKSNGPMCFVEFEDIQYATLALQEMHGNPLSNSVKGGIRLSFSKNPLGVRQNNVTSLK